MAVVAALAVLACVCLRTEPVRPQSFRMTNGVEVTLMAATNDTNQTIVLGKPYQRALYRLLPAKWKLWSGAKEYKTSSFSAPQTMDPTFWLLESSPDLSPHLRALVGSSFSSGISVSTAYFPVHVLDEFGVEYGPNGSSMGTVHIGPNEELSYYQINAPDPHGKIVGLCIYDPDARSSRLATFMIPGWTNGAFSAMPHPPPLLQRDGDLEIQMISLLTGLWARPLAYTRMTNEIPFSQMTFRLKKDGVPVFNWTTKSIKITDAHGGEIPVRSTASGIRGTDRIFNFEGKLDPANGPFKLRMGFTHYTGFASNELVTVRDVPFPDGSESREPMIETEVLGKKLMVKNIYATNAPRPVHFFQSNQVVMRIEVLPMTAGDNVQLVAVEDEQGREVLHGNVGAAAKGDIYFGFQPYARAKSMKLTFAVHKSRSVEFEAMPVMVATNDLSAKKY